MHGNVANDALRNLGLRSVDRNAAAVLVVDCDDIVDVRVLGEKFAFNAP